MLVLLQLLFLVFVFVSLSLFIKAMFIHQIVSFKLWPTVTIVCLIASSPALLIVLLLLFVCFVAIAVIAVAFAVVVW